MITARWLEGFGDEVYGGGRDQKTESCWRWDCSWPFRGYFPFGAFQDRHVRGREDIISICGGIFALAFEHRENGDTRRAHGNISAGIMDNTLGRGSAPEVISGWLRKGAGILPGYRLVCVDFFFFSFFFSCL